MLSAAPTPAEAFEVSGGVSLGGILVGTKPRFAVSPQAGLSWRTSSGFLFAVRELCSILPAINEHGAGVFNQTSAAFGYASESAQFSLGPSLSIYSTPACNSAICARVTGISPGAQAQASVYFSGPLGVSLSAGVDWIGGSSKVVPGGVAAMVAAGPVLRWRAK